MTNGMDVARLARIREADLPALEIDLSRLVTESEFTRLSVEAVAGKRWLHHPAIEAERDRLRVEWTTAGAASPFSAPQREGSSGRFTGESGYPSQCCAGPKETDLWLKGEALERWKRENPEAAAISFPDKD